MKKIIGLFILGLICTAGLARAGENMGAPHEGSPEFQQLKSLEGEWEGVSTESGKEAQIVVDYEVTSNGNVLMEHLFPGTPHAMLTTYYDKGGKVNMVHYCAIGNRPLMELIKAENNKLFFALSPESDINPAEPHMHTLIITLVDEDHIAHEWGYYQDGKPAAERTHFEFTRVEDDD